MDENEVVMSQGKEYKPEGESYVQDPFAGVADTGQEKKQEVEETETDGTEAGTGRSREAAGIGKTILQRPVILLALIVGLVIVGITVFVICSSSAKNKKLEEERRHAEELLAGEEEVVVFRYTSDEVQELRLAGYTGDEIDTYEEAEMDAQGLIKSAEAARKAMYEEEILPYFNSASDEFKRLWKDTWVGQDDFDVSDEYYDYFEETVNVDYTKLEPKGHQLFIKYYLTNDSNACFMTVTPERYSELEDAGNIVLKIRYAKTSDGTKVIVDASEIIP